MLEPQPNADQNLDRTPGIGRIRIETYRQFLVEISGNSRRIVANLLRTALDAGMLGDLAEDDKRALLDICQMLHTTKSGDWVVSIEDGREIVTRGHVNEKLNISE